MKKLKTLKLCARSMAGPGALICAKIEGYDETYCGVMQYDGSVVAYFNDDDGKKHPSPEDGKITRVELRNLAAKVPAVDKFLKEYNALKDAHIKDDQALDKLRCEIRDLRDKLSLMEKSSDDLASATRASYQAYQKFWQDNHPLVITKGPAIGDYITTRAGNSLSLRVNNKKVVFGIGCKRLTRDQLLELHKLSEAVGSGKIKLPKK